MGYRNVERVRDTGDVPKTHKGKKVLKAGRIEGIAAYPSTARRDDVTPTDREKNSVRQTTTSRAESTEPGPEACVTAVYERDYAYLRRIALQYVAAGDADDIVQDAFVSALMNASAFRQDSSWRTWMHRIVVNGSIDRHRQIQRRAEVLRLLPATRGRADSIATSLDLRAALRSLQPTLRAVCLLFAFRGLSHAEVANVLRIKEGTSKWRLARARTLLAADIGRTTERNARRIRAIGRPRQVSKAQQPALAASACRQEPSRPPRTRP